MFILLGSPTIYFDVMVPAAVDLPSDIKLVAVIDRSQSDNNVVNVLEKGLLSTLSGKGDRLSKHCIDGVAGQLSKNQDISTVITGIVEKRPGTALDFPKPLIWEEVQRICNEYKTDAVMSLEIFSRQVIDNVAEVKVGFRIYDPKNKMILDEFQYFHGIKAGVVPSEGQPEAIVSNLINSDDALINASFVAGTIYGKRISPFWIRVNRKYYKRSKRDPQMAEGARMMEVNNWDAAEQAFLQAIENGHRKTKGKALHNLAIVYEINGNLDQAFACAQDAWGKYGNKASREYSGILQYRINEVNLLRNQQEN